MNIKLDEVTIGDVILDKRGDYSKIYIIKSTKIIGEDFIVRCHIIYDDNTIVDSCLYQFANYNPCEFWRINKE